MHCGHTGTVVFVWQGLLGAHRSVSSQGGVREDSVGTLARAGLFVSVRSGCCLLTKHHSLGGLSATGTCFSQFGSQKPKMRCRDGR